MQFFVLMHEEVHFLNSLIHPLSDSLYPTVNAGIVSGVEAISNESYERFRCREAHMNAVSSSGGICNDGARLLFFKNVENGFECVCIFKPFFMTQFNKQVYVIG